MPNNNAVGVKRKTWFVVVVVVAAAVVVVVVVVERKKERRCENVNVGKERKRERERDCGVVSCGENKLTTEKPKECVRVLCAWTADLTGGVVVVVVVVVVAK